MPEVIAESPVGCAIGAEEEANADHEKQPAERVIPLAPGNQHSYRRTRNADSGPYHPVAHLVG